MIVTRGRGKGKREYTLRQCSTSHCDHFPACDIGPGHHDQEAMPMCWPSGYYCSRCWDRRDALGRQRVAAGKLHMLSHATRLPPALALLLELSMMSAFSDYLFSLTWTNWWRSMVFAKFPLGLNENGDFDRMLMYVRGHGCK